MWANKKRFIQSRENGKYEQECTGQELLELFHPKDLAESVDGKWKDLELEPEIRGNFVRGQELRDQKPELSVEPTIRMGDLNLRDL